MRTVFALMLFSLSLSAQTINEQIHALEEATPEERVTLMNGIKEQLISMNTELRAQTIEKLREKLQHKYEAGHEHLNRENELEEHVDGEHPEEMMHHSEAMEMHEVLHQQENHHIEEPKEEHAEGEYQHENQPKVGEK